MAGVKQKGLYAGRRIEDDHDDTKDTTLDYLQAAATQYMKTR